jgi:hypothetical protein
MHPLWDPFPPSQDRTSQDPCETEKGNSPLVVELPPQDKPADRPTRSLEPAAKRSHSRNGRQPLACRLPLTLRRRLQHIASRSHSVHRSAGQRRYIHAHGSSTRKPKAPSPSDSALTRAPSSKRSRITSSRFQRECVYDRYHIHPPGGAPRQHGPLALRLAGKFYLCLSIG